MEKQRRRHFTPGFTNNNNKKNNSIKMKHLRKENKAVETNR